MDFDRLMDGRTAAAAREPRLQRLAAQLAWPPTLALVDFPGAAHAHATRIKQQACARIGITLRHRRLIAPSTAHVVRRISDYNSDDDVDGIFIAYPLPPGVDAAQCFDAISVTKDVDGLSRAAQMRVAEGRSGAFPAATAAAILHLATDTMDADRLRSALLIHAHAPFAASLSHLVERAGIHTTEHLLAPGERVQLATASDLIIACGPPQSVVIESAPQHACVVDACYGRAAGAVDVGRSTARIAAFAPSIGAVGPMTVSMLLEHTLRAAARHGTT